MVFNIFLGGGCLDDHSLLLKLDFNVVLQKNLHQYLSCLDKCVQLKFIEPAKLVLVCFFMNSRSLVQF